MLLLLLKKLRKILRNILFFFLETLLNFFFWNFQWTYIQRLYLISFIPNSIEYHFMFHFKMNFFFWQQVPAHPHTSEQQRTNAYNCLKLIEIKMFPKWMNMNEKSYNQYTCIWKCTDVQTFKLHNRINKQHLSKMNKKKINSKHLAHISYVAVKHYILFNYGSFDL